VKESEVANWNSQYVLFINASKQTCLLLLPRLSS